MAVTDDESISTIASVHSFLTSFDHARNPILRLFGNLSWRCRHGMITSRDGQRVRVEVCSDEGAKHNFVVDVDIRRIRR